MFTDILTASGLPQEASDQFFNEIGKKAPLGRAGQPHEIAAAVSFLTDHAKSAWTTGAILVVDGGALATGI